MLATHAWEPESGPRHHVKTYVRATKVAQRTRPLLCKFNNPSSIPQTSMIKLNTHMMWHMCTPHTRCKKRNSKMNRWCALRILALGKQQDPQSSPPGLSETLSKNLDTGPGVMTHTFHSISLLVSVQTNREKGRGRQISELRLAWDTYKILSQTNKAKHPRWTASEEHH